MRHVIEMDDSGSIVVELSGHDFTALGNSIRELRSAHSRPTAEGRSLTLEAKAHALWWDLDAVADAQGWGRKPSRREAALGGRLSSRRVRVMADVEGLDEVWATRIAASSTTDAATVRLSHGSLELIDKARQVVVSLSLGDTHPRIGATRTEASQLLRDLIAAGRPDRAT